MLAQGLMIGHFEPFHLGQMRSILHASGQVQSLHVVITPHPEPNPKYPVTLQDKARWLQMACQDLPFIHIHTTDEINNRIHDDFNAATIDVHKCNDKPNQIVSWLKQKTGMNKIDNPVLFVADNHPLAQTTVQSNLSYNVITIPQQLQAHSPDIHTNPADFWSIIHPQARGSYTKTVAIVGGESSGKTTMVHKLANYYGASFALEMGRLYVQTDLGGSETALQYSDYAPIALNHAKAIRQAKYKAPAPVTIVDTDFVTTQAFCEEYEGRTHPFVAACIDEFRLDYTIYLTNNTPWVADGMRSLGDDEARQRFADRLFTIYQRHSIEPYRIDSPDYGERFKQVVAFINKHIFVKGSP